MCVFLYILEQKKKIRKNFFNQQIIVVFFVESFIMSNNSISILIFLYYCIVGLYGKIKDQIPGKVDEKATQLHAIASLKVLLDATKPQRGAATSSAANHVKINLKETTLAASDRPNGNIDTTLDLVG